MRVIVTGSRRWSDRKPIIDRLADLPGDTVIVVGYNPETDRPDGVDRIVYQEAQKLGLGVEPHPAEWTIHDNESLTNVPCRCTGPTCKRAGHRRNEEMAELGAGLCIAFWDGRSSGTQDMMERAERYGIPVDVIRKQATVAA